MIQKLLNSWIRIATHMPNWQCFWISLSVLTFSLRLAHSSLADYRRLALIPRTLIPRILPHRTSHFTPALPRQFHSNESSWNVRSRGTKSSKGANFQRNESSWNLRSRGTKVPRERKFSLWSFRSRERKCRGTKRPGIVLRHPGTGFPKIPGLFVFSKASPRVSFSMTLALQYWFIFKLKNFGAAKTVTYLSVLIYIQTKKFRCSQNSNLSVRALALSKLSVSTTYIDILPLSLYHKTACQQ